MKAVYIYPEDLGVDRWSEKWFEFTTKFGYTNRNAPEPSILVVEIQFL
jgi:hypothetical protein